MSNLEILHNTYKYKHIPPDFNVVTYKELNEDLQHMTDSQTKIHYEYHGYTENRKYKYENIPADFDPIKYKELNKDLQHMSELEATNHYEYNGYKEHRIYKSIETIDDTNFVCNPLDLFPFPEYIIDNLKETFNEKLQVNNNYVSMHSNDLLITRKYQSDKHHEHLKYKIDNNILDILEEFILVLDFQNGGGGTTFFINTIVSKYKNNQTFVIARNYDNYLHLNINEEYDLTYKYSETDSILFLNKYKSRISKIFINHLYNHNINFINEINKLDKQIITITHDYYNWCSISQPFFHKIKECCIEPRIKPDLIITQHKLNVALVKNNESIKIIDLPDYKNSDIKINFNNDNIVVAILGNINNLKGKIILEKLIEIYKNTNIKIIVIGYVVIENFKNYYYYNSIEEFNNILIEQKPNIILELSIWPETYSYTLTLSMITQLPILCLKKKFNSVVENRLEQYTKTHYFSSLMELDALIKTKGQNYLYTISPILYYNAEWNNIFLTKTKLKQISKHNFIYDIKPYFIYFPQFHKIKENDLFFYENFKDTENLKLYNQCNDVKLDTPLLEYLGIETIDDYDLTNTNIIQKQVNLINDYAFSGIALFYYWFSENNVTFKNQIMDDVINNFFNSKVNMLNLKVFFIWANEDWTSNTAFGINEEYNIINNYTEENLITNSNKLMEYFKNDNYLKINNKPVFFIYHNYLIENVDLFYNILNEICIKNDFNGVHLVLNSFLNANKQFTNFYINFNYKKFDSRFYEEQTKQIKLDYKEYMDNDYHFKKNSICTLVTDFNNKARLFKPNRLEHSTVCVNNSEINKIAFIKKNVNLYKTQEKCSELNKILLVNAFNEWGENMTFEPSSTYEYYNLNLLVECLSSP